MEIYLQRVVLAILPLQMIIKIKKIIKPVNFIEYGMNFSVTKVVQKLRFYLQCAKKKDLEEHLYF